MRARLLSKRAIAAWLVVALATAGCQYANEPEPTPPPPDPANPDPLALTIEHIELAPMANDGMYTGVEAAVPRAAAEDAVEATRAALERYMNAQFVDAGTRFTDAPARALLQAGVFDALPADQQAALGAGYLTEAGVVPQRATGKATVLFNGANAYAVSIDFRMQVDVYVPQSDRDPDGLDSGVRSLVQVGTVLFTAHSWAVESFELSISGVAVPMPAPPPGPPESASATATVEATP